MLPGRLTPLLHEQLTHLGAWVPFAPAAQLFSRFTHISVSPSTVQRLTEAVGLTAEALQDAQAVQIADTWPEVPPGPSTTLLSVDGAMVPLVGGVWTEAKTLVVGQVEAAAQSDGSTTVTTSALSYYSRVATAEDFGHGALAELYRRGVERAEMVVAVTDGAEWIQGFVDYHCPEAVRILDFPHAASRISQLGDVVLGEGSKASTAWRTAQLHALKHDGPTAVLEQARTLAAEHLNVPLVAENLGYLEKRIAQMQYPHYQAQHWPIGSGVVESANKLVVEARLKGAGMHWSRASVNPMLALRNAVCNDRWDEMWLASANEIRRNGRRLRPVTARCATEPPVPGTPVPPPPPPEPPTPTAKPVHPWRRTNYATRANLPKAKP